MNPERKLPELGGAERLQPRSGSGSGSNQKNQNQSGLLLMNLPGELLETSKDILASLVKWKNVHFEF